MDLSATTTIHAAPAGVYDYVSDPRNDVYWRTGLTDSGLTTEPPLRLGSEGFAKAGDKTARWRVTSIVPGVSVDWDLVEGPISGSGGYLLEAIDEGTLFTLVADVEPKGALRLLGPIFGAIGRRQNQADVDRLKGLLEAPETGARSAD